MRTAFTKDDPALPMHYPGFVFRSLREEGYLDQALLAGTGLTKDRLGDPNHRFSFSSLRRLTLNAMELTGDPHLGLRLGAKFEATYVGLPAYTAMNAARFEDALGVLTRFFSMSFPTIEFSLEDRQNSEKQSEIQIRLRPNMPYEDIGYFISGFAVVACDGLFRAILRRPKVTLRGQMMASAPADWAHVASQVGFPLSFGTNEIRLILPADLLGVALPGADPINHARLLALCEETAASAGRPETPVGLVVAYLKDPANIGTSLSETAAALGFSERGLRRQLEQAGTSFRALVDQVQETRARDLLINTTRPISVVAYELGYESPSNFARSFKRWTGMTPKAFRDAQSVNPELGRK